MLGSVVNIISAIKKLPQPETIQRSTEEAADQLLGNASKAQLAHELIVVAQEQDIADDEIYATRALKRKRLGKDFAPEPDAEMGDRNLTLADNITNITRSNGWLPWIVVAATLLGGAWILKDVLRPPAAEQPTLPNPDATIGVWSE